MRLSHCIVRHAVVEENIFFHFLSKLPESSYRSPELGNAQALSRSHSFYGIQRSHITPLTPPYALLMSSPPRLKPPKNNNASHCKATL